MKKILFAAAFLLVAGAALAQVEVSRDVHGNKVLKGFLSQDLLSSDSTTTWYADYQKDYTPEPGAVKAFRAAKDSIHILAFSGTWCSDSKYIIPKFFAITDAASFPKDRVTLLGVDENKKTVHHLSEAFNVLSVPTFIVLKNGKEVGRVVEYGKTGMFDRELGEIIAKGK